MAPTYTNNELRSIGERCSNRLPPASAVQAMHSYELQRDTEVERLFHGLMFDQEQSKQHSKSLEDDVTKLQSDVSLLQSQMQVKEVEKDGLSTAMAAQLESLRDKVDNHLKTARPRMLRLVLLEKKLEVVYAEAVNRGIQRKFDEQRAKDKDETNGVEPLVKMAMLTNEIDRVKQEIAGTDDEVQVLFDERDAMVTWLGQTNKRIEKAVQEADERMAGIEELNAQRMAALEKKVDEKLAQVEEKAADSRAEMDLEVGRRSKLSEAILDLRLGTLQAAVDCHAMTADLTAQSLTKLERSTERECSNFRKEVNAAFKATQSTIGARVSEEATVREEAIKQIQQTAIKKEEAVIQSFAKQIVDAEERCNERVAITERRSRKHRKMLQQLREGITGNAAASRQQVATLQAKVDKLEGLVRALTGQHANVSPASTQRLAVRSPVGQNLDLSIPKGSSLASQKKESPRKATPVKHLKL